MSLLIDWYKANQLSLNISKTVLIKFWPNNDKEFRIKIGQADVINQTHTKFLGVTIDDHLTWHEHCNTLYNKLLVNKRLLQNARNLLPMSSLLGVYYAHIYSHICVVCVMPLGFEDDPMAVRTFDASGEEVGQL